MLIASRTLPASAFDAEGDLVAWIGELTFVGLIGLMDPLRPEAKQAIAECRQAGIAVKMITGDHPTTASAIAAELGIQGSGLSGAELDRTSAEQLADTIDDIGVFARVTPAHKVKIVRALQAKGHVVAVHSGDRERGVGLEQTRCTGSRLLHREQLALELGATSVASE